MRSVCCIAYCTKAESDGTADALPSPVLPTHSRIVVCGGGTVGCSIAYHLTQRGETDVLLLDQYG